MKKNILIIIRGPSCSGKTTLAKKLFSSSNNKTAIIQQDHYREIFNPPGGGSKHNGEVIPLMIEHNTKVALENGYNVILEGVFNVETAHETDKNVPALWTHRFPALTYYQQPHACFLAPRVH